MSDNAFEEWLHVYGGEIFFAHFQNVYNVF